MIIDTDYWQKYRYGEQFFFENSEDAVLFKLTWIEN